MRILVRAALWPVRMALTILEWAVLFITHFVGIVGYMMAGGCFLIGVAGWLMGLAPAEETVRTLGIGIGFFAVPLLCDGLSCSVQKIYRWVRNIVGKLKF